jgi:6-phosphofructokinase 2
VAEARAETRVFVAVRERRTGRSLLLNPRGGAAGEEEQAALLTELQGALRAELQEAAAAQAAPWVVSSGSVPPGFGEDFHARVCDVALGMGARVVVDSDGPALRAAAARCTLLVPNRHEAERLLGAAIRSMRDAGDAALALLRDGAAYAAITLGEEGAVLATCGVSDVLFAQAPAAPAHASAVGAGDAFLAGLLLKLGVVDDGSALRYAVACGTAVLHADGAALLRVQDVERLEPLTDMKKAG